MPASSAGRPGEPKFAELGTLPAVVVTDPGALVVIVDNVVCGVAGAAPPAEHWPLYHVAMVVKSASEHCGAQRLLVD